MTYTLVTKTDPPRNDLYTLFGCLTNELGVASLDCLKLWDNPRYGDNTPRSLDGCLEKIDSGEWLPILYYANEGQSDVLIGAHWSHDFSRGLKMTWQAGYKMPFARGMTPRFHIDVAPQIAAEQRGMGFDHIFYAVIHGNSMAWSEAKSWPVGIFDNFLRVNDELNTCHVFTLNREDIPMAQEAAERRVAALNR